jgi:hypothetical protein
MALMMVALLLAPSQLCSLLFILVLFFTPLLSWVQGTMVDILKHVGRSVAKSPY